VLIWGKTEKYYDNSKQLLVMQDENSNKNVPGVPHSSKKIGLKLAVLLSEE
jgi:hypothetical protein